MEVLVCHRQRIAVHLARLNLEHHGARIRIASRPKDVLTMARAEKPDLIVLGNDLKDPTTDELVTSLKTDPLLGGVKVVIVKGSIPDLLATVRKFPWPTLS